MTSDLRDEDLGSIRQAGEIDADQVDDAPEASGGISTAEVDRGSADDGPPDGQADGWADRMADGEDYDESIGESSDDGRVLATDELDEIDDDDAPEGSESRDEEFEGDDPADIPDEHGGSAASIDTDDNGVDDTTMPEGTDRIIDENDDDWE
ncbi:hypothetical protein LG314_03125 [Agrococcus terreus]|uniref:hypothetical protein n=1 Tax=Agrococcus terreus TaxID=574649 RepID=UPI003851512B